jgi:MinD-like ATPase involved in chromosome partitioning or flagellar assembly/tetratricopeptide (TPR) repeat protein
MPWFVTFYSYKGGVGRSLALANVAWAMASRGRRVVAVDMDLEAPSIHTTLPLESKPGPGLIHLAAHYSRRGSLPASLEDYLHRCPGVSGRGGLWVMSAGSGQRDYQALLNHTDWLHLHPKLGTAPFLKQLREALAGGPQPHYVLIDSRTGFSDIGGLSTHQLADAVVLVFNLTRPCLEGTVRAYRSMWEPEDSRLQGLTLVASPVPPLPPDDEGIVSRRLNQAAELMPAGVRFGREIVRVEYDPGMALADRLAVQEPGRWAASERYLKLLDCIQRDNPREVFPVVELAREALLDGERDEALRALRSFTEDNPQNAEGFEALGDLYLSLGQPADAADAFRAASELASPMAALCRKLGEALVKQGDHRGAREALESAARAGDTGPALYAAMVEVYTALDDTEAALEARRKEALCYLPKADLQQLSPIKLEELRARFLSINRRAPPYRGFKPERFWSLLLDSISLTPREKLLALQAILRGEMSEQQIRLLARLCEEERAFIRSQLGDVGAGCVRQMGHQLLEPRRRTWAPLASPDVQKVRVMVDLSRPEHDGARESTRQLTLVLLLEGQRQEPPAALLRPFQRLSERFEAGARRPVSVTVFRLDPESNKNHLKLMDTCGWYTRTLRQSTDLGLPPDFDTESANKALRSWERLREHKQPPTAWIAHLSTTAEPPFTDSEYLQIQAAGAL